MGLKIGIGRRAKTHGNIITGFGTQRKLYEAQGKRSKGMRFEFTLKLRLQENVKMGGALKETISWEEVQGKIIMRR